MTPTSEFLSPRVRRPSQRRVWWLVVAGLGALVICSVICLSAALVTLLGSPAALPVTLVVSGSALPIQTTARTVGDLLREQALTIGEGDTISPLPETLIKANLIVTIERARAVTLTIDGQSQTVRTLFTNPVDILRNAGLTLGEKDRVLVDGSQTTMSEMLVWPVPATHITVQHAVTLNITDGTTNSAFQTTQATVGEALFEAGIRLYLADSVTPDLNAPITPDMHITIQRSQPVSIVADGVTLETRTQGSQIADALASANVPLIGLDYTIPDESSPLQPGMTIRVIRVTEQIEFQQTAIPFETVYQADPTLELDQQVVLQEGRKGIQQTNVRVRSENGVEVSRATETDTVALTPVNRIIGYGTNVVIRTIDTPDGPREYWRKIHMYATSYHPSALGGDNITATGRVLTKGIVGINPKIIPYDTQLYVPDYGVGIAADTGGPRRIQLWIDLGYDDSNWVSWSKLVDVYLLTPVPTTINYVLPDK